MSDHIVGAWLFDEGDGELALDSSGNGHSGTFVNAQWTEGRYGGAAKIVEGENYVEITSAMWMPLEAEMTISVWVFLEALPEGEDVFPNRRILQAGTYDPALNVWGIFDDHFRLLFELGEFKFEPHPMELIARDYTAAIDPGRWVHLAAVYSGEALQLYVDGELYAEEEGTGSPIGSALTNPARTRLYIGTKSPQAPDGDWWDGLIDETAIFAKALTQDEIQQVMGGLERLL